MTMAVILSGGIGKRMNMEGYPKQYLVVHRKPILMYALEAFQEESLIDGIIIVASGEWRHDIMQWLKKYQISKFKGFADPGDSRQRSILNGLEKCMDYTEGKDDQVVIHDGVRPLVSTELIHNSVLQLNEYDGCMPVVPVTDTIYCSSDGNTITGLLDRNILFGGQTPEAYKLRKYLTINENASEEELLTSKGSSEIAFKHGMNIRLIKGEEINFKITTRQDLLRFKDLIEKETPH